MNLLKQIPLTQTGEDFKIQFSDIKAGWLDVSITSGTINYTYCASYISDAPLELVETAIQMLRTQAEDKSAVLYHDLEGSMVTWYFAASGNNVAVFIWDNMYPDPFDNFIDCNFESDCMEALDENVDLRERLVLAFETTERQFAKAIVAAFSEIRKNYSLEEYAENWRNSNPEVQLKELQQMLLT